LTCEIELIVQSAKTLGRKNFHSEKMFDQLAAHCRSAAEKNFSEISQLAARVSFGG